MDYNTEKYNSLLFETQKNEFDKNIKGDKIYGALQTLSNLSYYNRLLEIPEDIDIAFGTFINFLVPVISPSKDAINITPTSVISAVELTGNSRMGISLHKLAPGSQYPCIGIFIPYNQFMINFGDPKKPVPIDFSSGTNHNIYSPPGDVFGGEATPRPKPVARKAALRKVPKAPTPTPSLDEVSSPLGKFVFFSKTNDPFGDAVRILAAIEARNVAFVPEPKIRRMRWVASPPEVVPVEYANAIPKLLESLAKRMLGTPSFANPEDMWVEIFRSGKATEFFRELNGLPKVETLGDVAPRASAKTIESHYSDVLLTLRRKLVKSEQELQEMYRKDSLAKDPLFAELNKYIIAIKGRRLNFLKARPTEFDSMLCQHYVEMKNQLLVEAIAAESSSESASGNPLDKIIEKFGDHTTASDGVYCSICGEVIVLEKTFLSVSDEETDSNGPTGGNLVPKDEITSAYYEMAYAIISSNILTEMNLKTLIDNIIYRIYPLIREAIKDIPGDMHGMEVIITMYLLAALMSLSILEPDVIAFKVFRDGTKKLSGNAIAQQKAIATEAKGILTSLRSHSIRESLYQRDIAYKQKMDTEAFPQVHELFYKLMGAVGDNSFIVKDRNEQVGTLTIGDLEGYNFYAAIKKMDNITGGDGEIISLVLRNFVKSKSVSTKSLLKGIYPGGTELSASKRSLLFGKDGEFKSKALKELLFPRVLTENEKHALRQSSGNTENTRSSGGPRTPRDPLLDFRKWHVRANGDMGRYVTPAMTVSNLSHIGSYGVVKSKTPEAYFCVDYGMHKMGSGGSGTAGASTCSVCGYIEGTTKINANPKYSRMLEFYNIYSISCPESGDVGSSGDEVIIGSASSSRKKKVIDAGFHEFVNGKCKKCSYSSGFSFNDRADYFEKYKGLLEDPVTQLPKTENTLDTPVTIKMMDRSILESLDGNLSKVSKEYSIPSKRLSVLIDKSLSEIVSILITYFRYNGELYYYKDIPQKELLDFAKSLLLGNMLRDKTKGKLFIKDEVSVGKLAVVTVTGAGDADFEEDEADDYTLDNAEDDHGVGDNDEEILDLALDEEDRFDQADAE